jgi:hypothetical protein
MQGICEPPAVANGTRHASKPRVVRVHLDEPTYRRLKAAAALEGATMQDQAGSMIAEQLHAVKWQ